MGADAIVARPDTITGSIGVVFGKFNVRGLYEWAGAHVDSVSFAENAGIMSPFSTMSESQRALMTDLIGAMYDDFTAKVAEGRGLPVERVRELAKGRIWSGVDALENGLVDRLGGLDVAVEVAAQEAGWGDAPTHLVVYPEKKDLLQQLLEGDLEFAVETGPDNIAGVPVDLQAAINELGTPRARVLMPEITLR
jgi:protease-4